MKSSLYERIGGETAIMAAIDWFYEKVLADELTRPFFIDLDMEMQSRKQIAFMARAFGGPNEWKGRPLRSSHAHLVKQGLSDVHFDAIVKHLDATLHELGIAEDLIQEVRTILEGTREQVLGR